MAKIWWEKLSREGRCIIIKFTSRADAKVRFRNLNTKINRLGNFLGGGGWREMEMRNSSPAENLFKRLTITDENEYYLITDKWKDMTRKEKKSVVAYVYVSPPPMELGDSKDSYV